MMQRKLTLALAALLVAAPLSAQEPPANPNLEEARLTASKLAWADLPIVRVLDDLGLSSDQANRLQPVLAALQAQFRAIDTRLAAALQAAAADISATNKALLAGRPAPVAADLARYEQMRDEATRERDDAVLTATTKVDTILTKQQRALIQQSDMATPPGQPKPRPEYLLKAHEAQARWQAQVQQTMMRLLQQGRGETNPQRYAQLAPQACLQAAAQATGLAPREAAVQALAKQLVAGLDQARRLNPAEVAQRIVQLAAAMVRAVSDTLASLPNSGLRPPVLVTSADLEDLVRYERSPLLLQSWVRERPAVLIEAPEQPGV